MQTATVGQVQKNFSKILKTIHAGEEITITHRGKPIAKLTALGPKEFIDWPDFYEEAIETSGRPLSEIITENRKDRF